MQTEKSKVYFIIIMVDSVRYVFPEVKSMNYLTDDNGEEYVRVFFRRVSDTLQSFDINVTADSLNMMAVDVWRGIARRFT